MTSSMQRTSPVTWMMSSLTRVTLNMSTTSVISLDQWSNNCSGNIRKIQNEIAVYFLFTMQFQWRIIYLHLSSTLYDKSLSSRENTIPKWRVLHFKGFKPEWENTIRKSTLSVPLRWPRCNLWKHFFACKSWVLRGEAVLALDMPGSEFEERSMSIVRIATTRPRQSSRLGSQI